MTEKHYGGASAHGLKKDTSKGADKQVQTKTKNINSNTTNKASLEDNRSAPKEEYEDYVKAGKIAREVVAFAKSFIKKDMKLLDIANKIEHKIIELKAKPAFPVNLSTNEVAAHYTPAWNDETLAHGLLKVDIGVHINGCTADTAFSIDLEGTEENKKLIEAAELAVNNAAKLAKIGITLSEIGRTIEKAIKSFGFQPIQNLSGHSIEKYDLHAGITVPNFDNSSNVEVKEGVFAIEPFATTGLGSVRDGRPSGIYHLRAGGNVRDSYAREVLDFIAEEYQTLPFCSRWIQKKFGSRGLLALRQIEQTGILHHYPQLIEKGNGKVAQAEHTILLTKDKKVITT
jgi:methionyl aminopeptidase